MATNDLLSTMIAEAEAVEAKQSVTTEPFDADEWREYAGRIVEHYGDRIVVNTTPISKGGVMADGSNRVPFAVKQAPRFDKTDRFNIVLWRSTGRAVYTNCAPVPQAA